MNRLLTLVFAFGMLFFSTGAQSATEDVITATDKAFQSAITASGDTEAKDIKPSKNTRKSKQEKKDGKIAPEKKDDKQAVKEAKPKEDKKKEQKPAKPVQKAKKAKPAPKGSDKTDAARGNAPAGDGKVEPQANDSTAVVESDKKGSGKPQEIIFQRQPDKHEQPVAPPISTIPRALTEPIPETIP
jgi:hypothetical protein